jgi:hypothetical protein
VIWLRPTSVSLGTTALHSIESISIDRVALGLVEEWSDLGPYQVFADVARERITCRIVRTLSLDDATRFSSPMPGEQHTLSFRIAPSASDAGRTQIDIPIVIRSVEHDPHPTRGTRVAITAIAISSDGATDPVIESEVAP